MLRRHLENSERTLIGSTADLIAREPFEPEQEGYLA